ncbi:hypothetical protein SNE26_06885 [Mucilaginibacter sp. cycad4]|nr:hypothetical protein [Mucilaginibacter gossypii]WPV01495.1 hypothetical protein SNE26_06885 [Mucilaginibacter gossypii]
MNRIASLLLLIAFIYSPGNNRGRRIIEENKWINILTAINYRIKI